MNKKKQKKNDKSIPKVSKSLRELMKDEDGFVSKDTILKVGLTTVAALGAIGSMSETASATPAGNGNAHGHHQNTVVPNSPNDNCVQHTNITTHHSY